MAPKARSPDRTISFSDALFAFAITLLAFNIKVPDVPDGMTSPGLFGWMLTLAPTLLIYALSFFVIANFWLAHHHLFEHVRRLDDALIWMNLAFLFVISLVPFPTAVLGEYGDTSAAAVLYAGFMGLTGLLLLQMRLHAAKRGHFDSAVSAEEAGRKNLQGMVSPAIFLLSIPVAFFSPFLAELSWLLIFFARPLSQRLAEGG